MVQSKSYVALDVGEKRIGVAVGDDAIKIAVPFDTVEVDGNELQAISTIVAREAAAALIIGYPRNQAGEPTAQTAYVEQFVSRLSGVNVPLIFQDESLTSVLAEQRLKQQKRPYQKAEVDAMAAAIILQDYLETNT